MVYDCTDEDSFFGLDGWIKELDNSAPADSVKCLICNKVDLHPDYDELMPPGDSESDRPPIEPKDTHISKGEGEKKAAS